MTTKNSILVKFTTEQERINSKMTGGSVYKFGLSKDVWLDLASKVFDRVASEQTEGKEHKAEGGEISAFLHAYGLKPSNLKAGQVNPFTHAMNEPEGFNHSSKELWLTATKREPKVYTDEEKAERKAKAEETKKANTLLERAETFASLVKSGALAKETVLPLIQKGAFTTEQAETALSAAIAKLA